MKSRVLTAIGLIPIVLGALFCASPYPIGAIGVLVAWLAARELQPLLQGLPVVPLLQSLIVAVGIPFYVRDPISQRNWLWMGLGAWVLGLMFTYAITKSKQKLLMGGIGAGLWPTSGLICLLFLHQFHQVNGVWNLKDFALLAFVPLWVGDSAGYFVGRAIGKHPLAPKISPKKTIEGGVANLISCAITGAALGFWVPVGWKLGLACGIVAGIFGQMGDLFESWVKRSADIKDSGSLLPGHGGILDRIDSVLFTAPLIALLLSLAMR